LRKPRDSGRGRAGSAARRRRRRFPRGRAAISRIANFDDLDPLSQEPGVSLSMVRAGEAIPGDTDLVILPGSKSTRAIWIFCARRAGTSISPRISGAAVTFSDLRWLPDAGQTISDPDGIEGSAGETVGLGLLKVDTVMTADKRSRAPRTHAASGARSGDTRSTSARPQAKRARARSRMWQAKRRGRSRPTAA